MPWNGRIGKLVIRLATDTVKRQTAPLASRPAILAQTYPNVGGIH
jgi:hypothetical protein